MMRQAEQEAEEDCQPRATKVVVVVTTLIRMERRPVGHGDEHLRGVGVRVAVGDEQEIGGGLGAE